jgi:hypothetical protein
MSAAVFADLEQTLSRQGPEAALQKLCNRLRQERDYTSLFYALLMQKRHQLGVSPLPTGAASELPESVHAPYEEGIRQAARHVGGLCLHDGNLAAAWPFFRMIGEPQPVREALEKYQPGEEDDVQTLVQIALYEGVHPEKGFDLVLQRLGICNAITTLSSHDFGTALDARQSCIRALVRALYEELRERLAADIERHEGKRPPEADAPRGTPGVVSKLLVGRDALFADDGYHIDLSHLSSVVQMSLHLAVSPELGLARELCEYGQHLSGRFVNQGDPPFEDLYLSHATYLAILAGERVEEGLDYFRKQAADADPETIGTYPAQVLVNLLLRLDRPKEALQVARKYLAGVDNRQITCPSIAELCHKIGDYHTLAEVAREQNDPVHFLAGLLAERKDS